MVVCGPIGFIASEILGWCIFLSIKKHYLRVLFFFNKTNQASIIGSPLASTKMPFFRQGFSAHAPERTRVRVKKEGNLILQVVEISELFLAQTLL